MKKVILLLAIICISTAFTYNSYEKSSIKERNVQVLGECESQLYAAETDAYAIYYSLLSLYENVYGGIAYAEWVLDNLLDQADINYENCLLLKEIEELGLQ